MENRKCPICRAGQYGLLCSLEVIQGKKTYMELAKMFKTTVEQAMEHVEEHVDREDVVQWAKMGETIVGRMERIITILDEQVETLAAMHTVDISRIKALANVVREFRGALMDYAELVGKVQRGQVVVQIQQVENKIALLTQVVLDQCCEDCRRKILEAIEGMT